MTANQLATLGRRHLLFITAAVGALIAVIGGGCAQEGPERVIVSGSVTYQGQPLGDAQIRFMPTKGTQAPVSGAAVGDGKYVVDGKGGVPVGTHRIEITAYRIDPNYKPPAGEAAQFVNDLEGPPREQYIPEKYNRNSELEITIETGSDDVTRDFDLTD